QVWSDWTIETLDFNSAMSCLIRCKCGEGRFDLLLIGWVYFDLTCNSDSSEVVCVSKLLRFTGEKVLFPELQSIMITSTSDGTRQGLDSMRGGVCATQGMKVVLKVGQKGERKREEREKEREKRREEEERERRKRERGRRRERGKRRGERRERGEKEEREQRVAQGYNTSVQRDPGGRGNGPLQLKHRPDRRSRRRVGLPPAGYRGDLCGVLPTATRQTLGHAPPASSLSSLTSPKRGGAGALSSSNNNGSEPSDIIIPLRTSDSAYCPHYEKVSGDYDTPVYIVQEMPPQSPANIYYKV
ncbi:hypothetical protein WMY93_034194, partial [Mugilogobius chulae]